MDTRHVAREVRLAQWAGILRERQDSGLSVRSYCLKQGINEKTYYYWQRRLRETACEGMVVEKGHTFLPSAHNESPIFAALPMSGSKNSGSIVVRLNGAEVEIRRGADPAAIDSVLRIVREC